MPVRPLPIDKGTYKTQDSRSLRNTPYADALVNQMIDQGGANFDRPTLKLLTTLDSIDPVGLTFFDQKLVVVTDDRKIYTIDAFSNITDITGVTLPGVDRPTFANDGSTLYIAGGGTPIKWAGAPNTTAALGGSPPKMTHIVYLDGYLIGNRRLASENNKVIQFSSLDTPETWSAINIFTARADPDEVQALAISARDLFVVGEQTVELWQNVGTSPVPFNRAFVYQYGTGSAFSVHARETSLFMLDQDRRFIRFESRSPARISEAIEDDLAKYDSVSDAWTGSFTYKGSIHVFLCFPSAGKAWSIDLKNNEWTQWYGYSNGEARVRVNCLWYEPSTKLTYAGDFATGKIWTFSTSDVTPTDAGGPFVRRRRMSNNDGGASVRKRTNIFRMAIDRNVASAQSGTTSQTNPQIELRFKDDGKEWSEWRSRDLGQLGTKKQYVEFRRLGVYRNRQYEYRMTDEAELAVTSIDVDEDVMAS